MTRRLTTYIITLGMLASFTLASGSFKPALAVGSIGSDVNSIDQKVDELNTIRDDDSLSAPEKAAKEFQTQQDILNGVVDLSENEISSIKDKLNKLPDFDKDSPEQKLRGNYLTELDAYNAYFGAEREKISLAAGVADLKAIASDIKAYRASGYNDGLQNMVTFTLLYYDLDITRTAKTRLDKITSDVIKLQDNGFLKKKFAEGSLNKAAGLISDAVKLHDQAKILILEPAPAVIDQTADNTTIGSTNATADNTVSTDNATAKTITDAVVTPPPTPRDLIEKSISDIKSAYNIFLQIGKDVRKALGLK